MTTTIRALDLSSAGTGARGELDLVADLGVRAWTPVFAAMRVVLGEAIDDHIHPGMPGAQGDAVREVCRREGMTGFVLVHDEEVAGFVALHCEEDPPVGVVEMIAVDPAHQRHGHGRALMDVAVDHLVGRGMPVLNVGTGGDPGHAPARALYEACGFRPLPVVAYFRDAEVVRPS